MRTRAILTSDPLYSLGFPGGVSGKESAGECRRRKRCRSIPGPGRSPGEGNVNPLQYSCLENPMDSIKNPLQVFKPSVCSQRKV